MGKLSLVGEGSFQSGRLAREQGSAADCTAKPGESWLWGNLEYEF